jgi:hypothetical protein
MSPTLEQTAQQIAEQRRQEAIKLFESAYAELLAPLRGSRMEYKAAIRKNDDVEIVFSKPGMRDLSLVMLPQGMVGPSASEPLNPNALITYLDNYLLAEEKYAVQTAKQVAKQTQARKVYTPLCYVLGVLALLVGIWLITIDMSIGTEIGPQYSIMVELDKVDRFMWVGLLESLLLGFLLVAYNKSRNR